MTYLKIIQTDLFALLFTISAVFVHYPFRARTLADKCLLINGIELVTL